MINGVLEIFQVMINSKIPSPLMIKLNQIQNQDSTHTPNGVNLDSVNYSVKENMQIDEYLEQYIKDYFLGLYYF